ncbi:MAG TPA: hypothetical protein VN939_16645 [Chthoniobacterales bacterium]|nr:hypothetical protein [Chthoniobacterales bacterium]
MKIGMLVVSVIGLSLLSSARGDDLPRMGYAPGTSVEDLVARGYRWATVNGPYACASQQNLRVITTRRTDLTELRLVTDGDAYYLIPGTLVRVVRDDDANGMSQILLGRSYQTIMDIPEVSHGASDTGYLRNRRNAGQGWSS